ncbi:UNVERIFIED_CONTAM: hypothetical protein HDU68_001551 [Siphonaria sp. JEL0065]|nr:hypothetical protein HDU68_001551 [Siphonaria sp. JEL0065]
MSICLLMTGSAVCPDFDKAGLSALVPAGVVTFGVTDISSLDMYILDSSDPNGTFGSVMKDSRVFNCTGWDGTGFRYYATALCASKAWATLTRRNLATLLEPLSLSAMHQ